MITGDAFLEYASKLAARNTSTEAEQRSAISRAYYGAYHLAKSFLERLGFAGQERDHDFVKNCLLSCSLEEAKQAGIRLGDLRTQRNRADYELKRLWPLNGGDPVRFIRQWVESAREIKTLLSQCSSDTFQSVLKADVDRFVRQQKAIRSGGRGTGPSVN